jgi:hypothetical protein
MQIGHRRHPAWTSARVRIASMSDRRDLDDLTLVIE